MPGNPAHPGEYIAKQLAQRNLRAAELASRLGISVGSLLDILHGKSPITGDIAARLGAFFGTRPEFWTNLQSAYELSLAEQETRHRPADCHSDWE